MESNMKDLRYDDADLNLFKERILEKLAIARGELVELISSLGSSSLNDGDGNFKTLEDGAATLEKESINQLAARQQKFIMQLEDALVRIENKTYGICKSNRATDTEGKIDGRSAYHHEYGSQTEAVSLIISLRSPDHWQTEIRQAGY